MVITITNKDEIIQIISDKIKGKKLIFTRYYYMSIAEKGLTHERVNEILPQFEKVDTIEKEELKSKDIGYELFYNLSNNTYFSIATIPKENNVLIVHAVEYKRDLKYRFKHN